MTRRFIDPHRLDAAIAQQLALTPPVLAPYRRTLTRLCRRHLPELVTGHRAQFEAGDPAWAQEAMAAGAVLFRLGDAGALTARSIVARFSLDIERLILVASDSSHPHRARAQRLLRGLAHWRRDNHVSAAGWSWFGETDPTGGLSITLGLAHFLTDADRAMTCVQADRITLPPGRVDAGRLIGTRARSCAELRRLGGEARNCLARAAEASSRLVEGHSLWALRTSEGQLVAIAEVDAEGVLRDVQGPGNSDHWSGYGPDIALWCNASGVQVDPAIMVPLAEFTRVRTGGTGG